MRGGDLAAAEGGGGQAVALEPELDPAANACRSPGLWPLRPQSSGASVPAPLGTYSNPRLFPCPPAATLASLAPLLANFEALSHHLPGGGLGSLGSGGLGGTGALGWVPGASPAHHSVGC